MVRRTVRPEHARASIALLAGMQALSACGGGATFGPSVSGSASPTPGPTDASRSPMPTPGSTGSNPSPTPAPASNAIPFAAMPDPDPFYAQPSSFPNPAPGTILDSRATTYAPDAVQQPNAAWQIKFVSRDIAGNAIASVATVVKPLVPFSGPAQPLLSVQYYENSLGSQCAPSHSTTGFTGDYPSDSEGSLPLQGLAQGMTLVFPDHLGPNTEYGVGKLHGQITLDGIRAALRFPPLGLGAQTPVGIEGYSGGAIASAWAASMQRSYAPELNVVAVASGGTPSNYRHLFKNFDTGTGNALFSIGLSVAIGVNRAYPSFVTPILNAKGVAAANVLKDGCGGNATNNMNPTGTLADYTTVPDPIDGPNMAAIYPSVDLPQAGRVPVAPMYVYQSMQDQLIDAADVTALVNTWCSQGTHIAYYLGAQGEHVAFDFTMANSVFVYLSARFKGQGDSVPMGSTTCN